MTETDVPTRATTPTTDAGRPRPASGVRAELRETPAGWVLPLHCDGQTALALQRAGMDKVMTGPLSVAITPNLVPGEPFHVDTVIVAVD